MLPVPLTMPAPNNMLPPVMLPVVMIIPLPPKMFPPAILATEVMLPVALIKPLVSRLPPVMFPVIEAKPAEVMLPAITLPVTDARPAVLTLPPITLPTADTVVPAVIPLTAFKLLAAKLFAVAIAVALAVNYWRCCPTYVAAVAVALQLPVVCNLH